MASRIMEDVDSFITSSIYAIKVLSKIILIGIGSYLHVYDKTHCEIVKRVRVFDETIVGIEAEYRRILVHGKNFVKLLEIVNSDNQYEIIELNSFVYNDWILATKFMRENDEIVVASMHSSVILLDEILKPLQVSASTEICTCYCAHIAYGTWSEVIVLAGTAFSQILIWRPSVIRGEASPILYKLNGHKGVIFSIDFSSSLARMCSTSDDGQAILWRFNSDIPDQDGNLKCFVSVEKETSIQHSSRVFRCKFIHKLLVTTAEDGTFRVYDAANDKLLKICNHQNGPIWAIDFCARENALITAGSDGGVVSTPLPNRTKNVIVNKSIRAIKNVSMLTKHSIAYVTNEGQLCSLNVFDEDPPMEIYRHEDLKSYSILERSPCATRISLSGYRGTFHIYANDGGELNYELSCRIEGGPRIYSFHWLTCGTFLTCVDGGLLIEWVLEGDAVRPVHRVRLPPSKERWSTAACRCGPTHFAVGDRKGNLFVYSSADEEPVQVFKKIHHGGITKIESFENKVFVLGRNALISKYYFNQQKGQLSLIINDKLPFPWLTSYHHPSSTVLGFSDNKFVMWDLFSRRYILKVPCGGGHRSWDYRYEDGELTFVYLQKETITATSFKNETEIANVVDGFHGSETNALKLIKLSGSECLTVSGGEDTTLRLCCLDFEDELNEFRCIETMKSHLSSIRSIVCHQVKDGPDGDGYLIFSAGGRAQIVLWRLDVVREDGNVKDIVLSEKFSYYKPSDRSESETRIMDMVTDVFDDTLYLFAACSDGKIKIYNVNPSEEDPTLNFERDLFYKKKCILKIFVIKMRERSFVVAASVDGFLTFLNANEPADAPEGAGAIAGSFKIHQSGINSYDYHKLDDSKVVVLTGGDDKAWSLNLFECAVSEDGAEVNKLITYTNETFHFCQVTGVFINSNCFITTAIDQKFILYKWKIQEGPEGAGAFVVLPLSMETTSIPNTRGISYVFNDGVYKFVVYGCGAQVFSITY